MADILAVVVILTALGLAYPALLTALRLIFSQKVESARLRLETRPWHSLWAGLGIGLLVAIPALLLIASPLGLFIFLGWGLVTLALAVAALGGAGLAQICEERAAALVPGWQPGLPGLRGAGILELAAVFPLIGWFLFFPLTTLAALGAAIPALLDRHATASRPAPLPSDAHPAVQG